MRYYLLLLTLFTFSCIGQGHLTIDKERSILGVSVSDQLSYFEDESATMSPEEFLEKKSSMIEVKMTSKTENVDFTASSFFIHFTLENASGQDQILVLETALATIDRVNLYCVDTKETVYSGDGIPFNEKTISSNYSVLPVFIKSRDKQEYILHLTSNGEGLSIPMVFSDVDVFQKTEFTRQFLMGLLIGIFIFVIIIFSSFYIMMRERLFLVYVVYVIFSGFLQFIIEGYGHKYIFPSGGYLTQHITILMGSMTIVFGMLYVKIYLVSMSVILNKIRIVLTVLISGILAFSVIPNSLSLVYPIISLTSAFGLFFMLYAIISHRRDKEVNALFVFGFASLIIGGLLFTLGKLNFYYAPLVAEHALKVGTLLEMVFLAILMARKYKVLYEERELARQELFLELNEKNRLTSELNERLEIEVKERTKEIEERTKEVEVQRQELKEKNEDFLASVVYAERIQSAILSNEEKFKSLLPDSFVLFQPKDVVSGDFFWIDKVDSDRREDQIAYITADCTGHGISGAFVSIVGNHLLESVKASNLLNTPGKALDRLSAEMNHTLNSRAGIDQIRDGMDLTFCLLDMEKQNLSFSGAKNSAYIIRNEELFELKGDRKSIGFNPKEESHEFVVHHFGLQKGDIIYTCSDGYSDQFGGEKGKKFMSNRLKGLFLEISKLSMEDQKEKLQKTLSNWMGDHEQLDDILVVGVKV